MARKPSRVLKPKRAPRKKPAPKPAERKDDPRDERLSGYDRE